MLFEGDYSHSCWMTVGACWLLCPALFREDRLSKDELIWLAQEKLDTIGRPIR
jgi:hypothetical protein